jgi:phosphatidylethanolamine-binding protein (PEBP) family uncharacterized protein
MKTVLFLVLTVSWPRCGAVGTGSPSALALRSSAFQDGQLLWEQRACDQNAFSEALRPPLEWTPVPDAKSYALVMSDLTEGFVHWVVWGIPADTHALTIGDEHSPRPSGMNVILSRLPKKSILSPMCARTLRRLQFAVYALRETTLSGLTDQPSRTDVVAAIQSQSFAQATLTYLYGRQ